MDIKIDVTPLRDEERCDMARLLFKCGSRKDKAGNKNRHSIAIRKPREEK